MKKTIAILWAILQWSTTSVYAQQNDSCKVLIGDISGTYNGACKDGFAHGKGIAKGKDTYDGTFRNGLPDGKGKYVYDNGNIFTGYWSKGLKNGQGKFVYYLGGKEYVQKGYWKDGNYVGITNPDEFYRTTIQAGVDNFSIKKVDDKESKIKITFIQSLLREVPLKLSIHTSSGELSQVNKDFIIYNYATPNSCDISFIIMVNASTKVCHFSFDILKPGNYEVIITNN